MTVWANDHYSSVSKWVKLYVKLVGKEEGEIDTKDIFDQNENWEHFVSFFNLFNTYIYLYSSINVADIPLLFIWRIVVFLEKNCMEINDTWKRKWADLFKISNTVIEENSIFYKTCMILIKKKFSWYKMCNFIPQV